MGVADVETNLSRRLAIVGLVFSVAACGGGGAAVDAVATPDPTGGSEPAVTPPSPSSATVVTTTGSSFSPATINVAVGAAVTWRISGNTHNVTFGSSKPAEGNVPNTASGGSATRTFPNSGTYTYECSLHSGMTGQVIVGAATGNPPTTPSPSNPGASVLATPSAFTPERLEITPGSTVTWEISGGTFGIVFEDDEPTGGNIPVSPTGSKVSRTFSTAGDYDYYNSKNRDVKGRIRVR